jgi:hypothetical protein
MRPTTGGEKVFRGVSEGSVIAAATDLATDATIYFAPWFTSRRTALVVILGAGIGALVRWTASKFIWYRKRHTEGSETEVERRRRG